MRMKNYLSDRGFGEDITTARATCGGAELISDEVKVRCWICSRAVTAGSTRWREAPIRGSAQHAPRILGGLHRCLTTPLSGHRLAGFAKLKIARESCTKRSRIAWFPCTRLCPRHPELYRDYAERPFKLITIVTDSIHGKLHVVPAPSDLYGVANDRRRRP